MALRVGEEGMLDWFMDKEFVQNDRIAILEFYFVDLNSKMLKNMPSKAIFPVVHQQFVHTA